MAYVKMKFLEKTTAKGRAYYYYRRRGVRVQRIREEFGTPEFLTAFSKAHADYEAGPNHRIDDVVLPGTFRELAIAYLSSPDYGAKGAKTQRMYRGDIDTLIAVFGDEQLGNIRMAHVLAYRDTLADTPGKANNVIKAMRIVFGWGRPREYCDINPADFSGTDIHPLRLGEHQPWPEPTIERYLNQGIPELVWVVMVGLYTGQRIGDCLKMDHRDRAGDIIRVVQQKGGKELGIPLHSDLRALLDVIPKRSTRILTTKTGRVWNYHNFVTQLRDDMQRLGIWGFVFHGLRKNAVNRLLEAGCTTQQVGAITGQSDEIVAYYARGVDQKRLARAAMEKLEAWTRGSTE